MVAQTLRSGYLCSGPASGERQFDHMFVERVRPDLWKFCFSRRAPEGRLFTLFDTFIVILGIMSFFEDREMVFSPSVAMCLTPRKGFALPKGLYGESSGQNLCRFCVSCVQAVCWTAYGPGNGFCPFQLYRHQCVRIPLSAVLLALVFHGLPARDQLPEEARRVGCSVS